MTEEQWLAATEPLAMLKWLSETGRADDERRCRLFACACVRRIWHLLTDERSRKAVQVAENHACGKGDEEQLYEACGESWEAVEESHGLTRLAEHTTRAAAWATESMIPIANAAIAAATEAERALAEKGVSYFATVAEQSRLLRCIFGNPFRLPPRLGAAVLSWNDRTVVRISETLYRDQQWDDVALLADALEEAGGEDVGIIEHLRGPGPHCRGCHVLDAVLGKA